MDNKAKRRDEFRKIKEDCCIKFLSGLGRTFDKLSNAMDVEELGLASKILQQILDDCRAWCEDEEV